MSKFKDEDRAAQDGDPAGDPGGSTSEDGAQQDTSYSSEGGEPTYGGESSGEPRHPNDTEYRTDGSVESGATGERF